MLNFADALQLTTYPAWVKYAMWGSGLCWFVVYAALTAFKPEAPKPALLLDAIRRAQHAPTGRAAIAVQLRNTMKEPASITELKLEVGTRPAGGLMSGQTTSQAYLVVSGDDPNSVLSRPLGGEFSMAGKLVKPYAGTDFFQLHVPITESLEDQKALRFTIIFDQGLNALLGDKPLRAIVIYNNGRETAALDIR